jgi:chloramphenicol-sensitive protein RarD
VLGCGTRKDFARETKSMNSNTRIGALNAIAAYFVWGFAPIYWKNLAALSATELLAYRVICAFLLTFTALLVSGELRTVAESLKQRRQRGFLVASGLLISINWGVFMYAVNSDQIVDTALGYFLAPLLNVALGVVVFRERLSRLSSLAVGMAAVGVAYMTYGYGRLPLISLALAGSFSLYGVFKKWSSVSPMGGLMIEAAILSLPALGFFLVTHSESYARFASLPPASLWLLLGTGLITAFPLVCFATAAKHLPLTVLGLFQYIAPSLSLVLAVWLYQEPFTLTHTISFSLIWGGLVLSSWEGIRSWLLRDPSRRMTLHSPEPPYPLDPPVD